MEIGRSISISPVPKAFALVVAQQGDIFPKFTKLLGEGYCNFDK
jgi:hypothetical protein